MRVVTKEAEGNLNEKQKVLDHGFVALVDYMGGDSRIVEAARRSLNSTKRTTKEQDDKLIAYLMKNKHWSPFEKVRFEFAIKMPIFVARQMVRHRMASINELSARYTKLPKEYYVPTLSRMQVQSKSNKQCSGDSLPVEAARKARDTLIKSCEFSYESYEELLATGLSREVARSVLPVNFYTEWYWTIDLRNLMNFIKLREDGHAQWEIQQYAVILRQLAESVAPVAMSEFTKDK